MPITEKKKASNAKWDSVNLKRISVAMPVALHEQMADHVQKTKETVNGFVKRAIRETIKNDDQGN